MILKSLKIISFSLAMLACLVSCGKEDPEGPGQEETPSEAVSNIRNSYEDDLVSFRGETVSVRFDVSVAWTASLVLKTAAEDNWASVSSSTQSGQAKKNCSVRIVIDQNETESERSLELWIKPEGHDDVLVATLVQAASGSSADARINEALNTYMHDILKED